MKRSLYPRADLGMPARSVGGARPAVQKSTVTLAESESPFLASMIYAPPSNAMTVDGTDPRYPNKENNVENIYHPAAEEPAPRSGIAQVFNWLMTGRMK